MSATALKYPTYSYLQLTRHCSTIRDETYTMSSLYREHFWVSFTKVGFQYVGNFAKYMNIQNSTKKSKNPQKLKKAIGISPRNLPLNNSQNEEYKNKDESSIGAV